MNVLQETDEESEDDTRIKLKLQNLFTIRKGILEEQGEELALIAKSKWYHEGEWVTINNQELTDPDAINL